MPLLNHRVHQAMKHGREGLRDQSGDFDFNYELAGEAIVAPQALVDALLALAKAAVAAGVSAPADVGRRDRCAHERRWRQRRDRGAEAVGATGGAW